MLGRATITGDGDGPMSRYVLWPVPVIPRRLTIQTPRSILLLESPPLIELAASSNITASGENTTVQLTAPAGKTTADFVAGRIQDD